MARVIAIIGVVAVTAVVSFVLGVRRGDRSEPRRPPSAPALRVEALQNVAALGKLVPRSGIVNVSALPGDQVAEITVAAGEPVKQGDVLATLKSRELRKKEWELAQARLNEARQKLEVEQELAASRLEGARLSSAEARLQAQQVQQQAATLELLRKQLQQGEKDLERLQQLADDPVTRELAGRADLERKELLLDKLRLDVQQAEQALEAARESHELAQKVAESQVSAAQLSADTVEQASPLSSLQVAVDLAKLQWELTEVRAPIDGRVLRILVNPGELVGNTPLMQVGDVAQMNCVAEVYESNLPAIAPGQRATMTSPALDEPLEGTVREVGGIIGTPSLPNPNPLSRQDVRTAEVVIELDQSSARRAADLINLQVNVRIDTGAADSPPEGTDADSDRT